VVAAVVEQQQLLTQVAQVAVALETLAQVLEQQDKVLLVVLVELLNTLLVVAEEVREDSVEIQLVMMLVLEELVLTHILVGQLLLQQE
jgi:hypothetical protein